MKFVKITLISGSALFIILLVTPFLIPKKMYLGWFIKTVESRYPVALTLADARLAFLPNPGIGLDGVEMKLKRGAVVVPLLKAEHFKVSLRWRDALRKKINPNVLLKNAEIDLEEQKYVIDTLMVKGVTQEGHHYSTNITLKGTLTGMQLDTDLAASLKLIDESAKQGSLEINSKDFSLNVPGKLMVKKEKVTLQADFSRDPSKTEISKGSLALGPQRLGLSGVLQQSGAMNLSLSADPLELEYLKKIMPALASLPEIQGASFKATYATDGSKGAIPTISGSLAAARVKIPDYDFSELSGSFFYHEPLAKISDFQAKTLDGSVSGSVEVNLQGEKPDYKFDLAMKDISIEKVPSASGLVAGKASLSVKGSGKGFASEDLSKSLSGDGTMSMNEVQIPAVKFFEGIFSSPAWDLAGNIPGAIDKNALAGLRAVDSKASSLATSFQLVEGRVQIPQVNLQFPKAVTNLTGSIGIDKTLAFNGTMNLDRELASSFIKNPQLLDALSGGKGVLAVPLQVTGTATKPVVSPDGEFIKAGIQNFAKAEAQKKAGDLLQGLTKPKLPGESTPPAPPPSVKVPSKEDIGNFFKKP